MPQREGHRPSVARSVTRFGSGPGLLVVGRSSRTWSTNVSESLVQGYLGVRGYLIMRAAACGRTGLRACGPPEAAPRAYCEQFSQITNPQVRGLRENAIGMWENKVTLEVNLGRRERKWASGGRYL